jgi:hypothetical protein
MMTQERLAEIERWYSWAKNTPEPQFANMKRPEHEFMDGDPDNAAYVREWRHKILAMVGDLLESAKLATNGTGTP